jgi:DNA (cytosine-5)-methyltransferase 1
MSRPPVFRAYHVLPDEVVVDNFAGGGGASDGIKRALGRPVDIAINHSAEAIAVHKANHPETRHYQEDIWEVDPREAAAGRPVGLAWFSPDCTHFSRAKGTTPLKKEIRGLAWVVIRWAKTVRPRVILLENVEEFQTWGPLTDENRPDPSKVGETFRAWLAELTGLGYRVEFRTLVAADYGTPTTRKRLFLVARCDGGPIVWPEPTHGAGRGRSWRPAAEIIDWSLPCPSIFDRPRQLAEATLRRIAAGIRRYVIEAASPFVLPVTHQGDARVHGIDEPLRTVTAANRGEFALCQPFIVRHGHYSTITGAGLREGCGAGTFRGQPLEAPLATVCATNDKHLVVPFIAKHYGGPNGHQVVGHEVEKTLGTVTARDHHALAAAFLTKFYGTSVGADAREPLPTVTSGGGRGGGHLAEVRAFLVRYYSAGGAGTAQQSLFDPLHTVTTRARFGLVMVHGEPYEIVDIGMRMLQPHELFAAQGFPSDYQIAPEFNGRPLSKTAQTELAGNSVCPPVAESLVSANAPAARRAA